MTGVTMNMRIMTGEPHEAIKHLLLIGTEPQRLLGPIGTGMVRAVHDRFANAVDAQGTAWAPLNPLYATTKKGPGILRGAAMRGGLMGSITRDVQGDELAWGTAKVYGLIHQDGGIIRPKNGEFLKFRMGGAQIFARQVTIPARPYLGWGAEEEEVVLEVTGAFFDRAIAAGVRAGGRNFGAFF